MSRKFWQFANIRPAVCLLVRQDHAAIALTVLNLRREMLDLATFCLLYVLKTQYWLWCWISNDIRLYLEFRSPFLELEKSTCTFSLCFGSFMTFTTMPHLTRFTQGSDYCSLADTEKARVWIQKKWKVNPLVLWEVFVCLFVFLNKSFKVTLCWVVHLHYSKCFPEKSLNNF